MSFDEPIAAGAPEAPDAPAFVSQSNRPGFSGPVSLIFTGMLCLSLVALVEARWLAAQPWNDAVILVGPSPLFPGPAESVHGAWIRPVSRRTPASEDALFSIIGEMARSEGIEAPLDAPERVIAAEIPVEALAVLLLSGRLPEPGKREVLAGDLARDAPFELDGEAFHVVGRLKQGVSGVLFAYILPYDAGIVTHFTSGAGAERAWIHLGGLSLFDGDDLEDGEAEPELLGGQIRTQGTFAALAIVGLVLVMTGGVKVHIRLFERLSTPPTPVFGPLLRETVRRRRLLGVVHVLLYGVFFGCMMLGLEWPLLNYRLMDYMSAVFSEGGLSYIGDAYASQDILQAALATYHNNYVVQTLGYTFLLSLPPLALGVLKTAVSFAVVGFAMTPLWAGAAAGYVFHSITMVLELEAYVVASFAVLLWPIQLWGALIGPRFWREVALGVRILIGGVILTGVMLAIAALYEAASLILLGTHV